MSLILYGRRSKFDEVIVRLKKVNSFFRYVVSAGYETRMRFSPSIVKNTNVTACYLIRETPHMDGCKDTMTLSELKRISASV